MLQRVETSKWRGKETEEYKERMVASLMKVHRDGGERKIEEFRWKRMCWIDVENEGDR